MCDSLAERETRLVGCFERSSRRAAWSRVRKPLLSTSAASLGVHGHARPLISWRAGCSRPEWLWPPVLGGGPSTRLQDASVPRRRLAAAEALGEARVGGFDDGLIGVCSVGRAQSASSFSPGIRHDMSA
jgi:hypothetical protein